MKIGADRQLNMGGKDITNNCIWSRSAFDTNRIDRSFLIFCLSPKRAMLERLRKVLLIMTTALFFLSLTKLHMVNQQKKNCQ